MATINVQLFAEGKGLDGATLALSPALALIHNGPVVEVTISADARVAASIVAAGYSLPPPIAGLAMIDTGASATCIDEEAAQLLKLPVIDVASVTSASGSATHHNVYAIEIAVVGSSIRVGLSKAVGGPLKAQGLLALIGRDVLQNGVLVYNGMTGSFSLSI